MNRRRWICLIAAWLWISAAAPAFCQTAPGSTPLPPPGRAAATDGKAASTERRTTGSAGSTFTVIVSLTVVIGGFLAVAWFVRKSLPGSAVLPKEALEVLGRAPLGSRQSALVVRFGNRLLLLSANSAGAETLAEITDIDEVERISQLCRSGRTNSPAARKPGESAAEDRRHG